MLRGAGTVAWLASLVATWSSATSRWPIPGAGVSPSTGSHDTISDSNVHHAWDIGIYLAGPYNTVQGCEVYRATEVNYSKVVKVAGVPASWWEHRRARPPPGSGAYAQIRNNIVYHNSGEGVIELLKTDYALVEGNVCYDNWAVQGIYSCNASYHHHPEQSGLLDGRYHLVALELWLGRHPGRQRVQQLSHRP